MLDRCRSCVCVGYYHLRYHALRNWGLGVTVPDGFGDEGRAGRMRGFCDVPSFTVPCSNGDGTVDCGTVHYS